MNDPDIRRGERFDARVEFVDHAREAAKKCVAMYIQPPFFVEAERIMEFEQFIQLAIDRSKRDDAFCFTPELLQKRLDAAVREKVLTLKRMNDAPALDTFAAGFHKGALMQRELIVALLKEKARNRIDRDTADVLMDAWAAIEAGEHLTKKTDA